MENSLITLVCLLKHSYHRWPDVVSVSCRWGCGRCDGPGHPAGGHPLWCKGLIKSDRNFRRISDIFLKLGFGPRHQRTSAGHCLVWLLSDLQWPRPWPRCLALWPCNQGRWRRRTQHTNRYTNWQWQPSAPFWNNQRYYSHSNQSVSQSVNRSINQSISQSVSQSKYLIVDWGVHWLGDNSICQPTNKTVWRTSQSINLNKNQLINT